jgi:hypothetical protein
VTATPALLKRLQPGSVLSLSQALVVPVLDSVSKLCV